MSADNGIYILQTPKTPPIDYRGFNWPDKFGYEYRVKELQAIENVNFDKDAPEAVPPPGYHSIYEVRPDDKAHCDYQKAYDKRYHSNNPDVLIRNARNMWKGCKVFTDKSSALLYASELEDKFIEDCGFPTEYGISFIKIERVF